MTSVQSSSPVWYNDGKAGDYSKNLGFSYKVLRTVRYSFTVPAGGMSRIAFSFSAPKFGTKTNTALRFYVGTDPNSHAKAYGTSAAYTGGFSVSYNSSTYRYTFTADAACQGSEGQTMYLWLFPGYTTEDAGWRIDGGPLTLNITEGAVRISSVTSTVETLGELNLLMERAGGAYIAQFMVGEELLYSSAAFASSLKMQIPREWFLNFPNAAELNVEVKVTENGISDTASIILRADEGMRPVIKAGALSLAAENTIESAQYIAGKSRARATVDMEKIDLSACIGATLSSCKVSFGAETISKSPYLSSVLTADTAVTLTVTDTRGRSASESMYLSLTPYSAPSLNISCLRSNSAGEEDESGNFCALRANVNYSPLGGDNAVTVSATLGGESYLISSGELYILGGALAADAAVNVTVRAEDLFGEYASATAVLPPRYWAMRFRPDGHGVGFGRNPNHDDALQMPENWQILLGERDFRDILYPVGSCCITSGESPATLLGFGTWAQSGTISNLKIFTREDS